MKKLILVFTSLILLIGCKAQPKYTMYFYMAKTCPVCRSFKNNVIPELNKKYSNMEIIERDIDDASSKDSYAEICSRLENYYYTEDSGSVPFIVLDGCFARVGYEIGGEEMMLNMIDDAINHKDLTNIEDYEDIEFYLFEED